MPLPPPGRGRGLPRVPWVAVVLWVGLSAPATATARQIGGREAGGQEGMECDVPSHQGFTSLTLSNGDQVLSFSRPVFRCSEGTRITTDSARVYESTQYYQLFGRVVFQDAESRLTAEEAQYFGTERRLRAWGNAVLTNQTNGSVIEGDTMVLRRAGEGRPEDQLTVTGRRPHATLYPARQTEEPPSPQAADTGAVGLPRPPPDTAGAGPPLPPPDTLAVGVPLPLPPSEAPESSSPAAEATPYDIEASRIVLEGSRYFRATGSVDVTRDSLTASADSVEYDQSLGTLSLSREAHLETASYDLSAEVIVLVIPQDDVREVLARRDAVLRGENLELMAPMISLFMEEGKLQRLVAFRGAEADSLTEEGTTPSDSAAGVPPARPEAVAEDFSLTADSLEVHSPDEVLDRVRAMGAARGESLGRDSLNTPDTPSIISRDWLEGDTIVATFQRPGDTLPTLEDSLAVLGDSLTVAEEPLRLRVEPEAPPDSAETGYELRRLVARGNARSLYRLAPSDSTVAAEGGPPAAHYVVGDEITILLKNGEVETMEVKGQTVGVHLEPAAATRRSGGEPGGGGR